MAKGIIYLMSTVADGLVKIGKTTDFETRMQLLENNGYRNVTGLKRVFAIRVDGYDEKEDLLHKIFDKSRVGDTELFSLDVNLAKQLLSALDDEIIYPSSSKEEIFEEATEAVEAQLVPDGTYFLKGKANKTNKNYNGTIQVLDGKIILLKNSLLAPVTYDKNSSWLRDRVSLRTDESGKLLEDYKCQSFSKAAAIVVGHNANGWLSWKNNRGEFIDCYRPKETEESE